MARIRLDELVLERGLAPDRARARALIMAGQILVDEQRADKAGLLVDAGSKVRLKQEPARYVSRGGLKLEALLAASPGVKVAGAVCLDVGASTGGFTDCLLQHGASFVHALDVGHNQLAWRLRGDPRVSLHEGINARHLDADQLDPRPEIVTIDVAFISLKEILPPLCRLKDATIIALAKPQFEARREEVGPGGIISREDLRGRILERVRRFVLEAGFEIQHEVPSPIEGRKGNRETFLVLKKRPARG